MRVMRTFFYLGAGPVELLIADVAPFIALSFSRRKFPVIEVTPLRSRRCPWADQVVSGRVGMPSGFPFHSPIEHTASSELRKLRGECLTRVV